jgi:hypothetical protein
MSGLAFIASASFVVPCWVSVAVSRPVQARRTPAAAESEPCTPNTTHPALLAMVGSGSTQRAGPDHFQNATDNLQAAPKPVGKHFTLANRLTSQHGHELRSTQYDAETV